MDKNWAWILTEGLVRVDKRTLYQQDKAMIFIKDNLQLAECEIELTAIRAKRLEGKKKRGQIKSLRGRVTI